MPHARPTSPSPPARPAQALLLVAAAALAATCGPAPPGPPQPAASTAPTGPRLVVLVVVDQLPSWSFAPVLARSRDGFARLRDHGVYYPEAEVPYATTYTSSGHAALGTGAPPALTGVLDNGWYRPEQGTVRSATHDPDSPVFQLAPVEPGRHGGHGRSGTALRVDGLAEMLARARGGRARSVSISLKDRAAAFVAGRHPDLAVWYDDDQAAMTTSRFYAPTLPPWLRALHEQGLVASRLDWVWTPLPELDHLALTGGPDVAPGESTGDLLGPGFPHDLARSPAPATALRLTPAGDELVMVTARAAIDALGLGTGPVSDFLALSFSAHDYASHYWGQESWERLDLVVRLDRALGEFMDELDRRLGPDGYALLLTSDHGTTRLVERSRAAGRLARRIAVDEIERAAAAAATTALGPGEWVAAGSRATLHLGADFDALPAATRESALDAVVAAVAAIDGIQYAARVDRIAGGCDRRAGLEALACRSLVPGASGHVYFAAAPDSVITEHPAGTGHGSPNPDDRTVPIFVYAPAHPRWARARVERRPVSLLQVAPTLATLLGVPAPPAATAPPLP